jgi:hypothetical protein
MLFTITLSIIILVAVNFLLLFFSCNKTKNSKVVNTKPVILYKQITMLPETEELAPTGS